MSLTAKVRPDSGRQAAGGGGWGKGRSSSRSIKAPKSSFITGFRRAFRLLLLVVSVKIRRPVTPMPTTIQSLGLERLTLIFPSLIDLVGFASFYVVALDN